MSTPNAFGVFAPRHKAASSPPGTPHSCGSGMGIVRICRLKPAFRHRTAWGGELDAALAAASAALDKTGMGPPNSLLRLVE